MPALLQVDCQRRHELGERLSIGRGGDNDIRLDDPMISPHHAEVVRNPDGSYCVRDLGSRRGTFVGSRKVAEAALRDGDELLIGPTRLRFETARPASPTSCARCARSSSSAGRSASNTISIACSSACSRPASSCCALTAG
jgi:predicted component of type VI protein secretion system